MDDSLGLAGSAVRGGAQHAGRTAALLVVLLAAVHVAHLAGTHEPATWVRLLVGAACLVAVPVSVGLWRGRGLECRTCAALLALGSATTQLLAVTVGPPGRTPNGWTPVAAVVLALALGILLLVCQETLVRLRTRRAVRPYA